MPVDLAETLATHEDPIKAVGGSLLEGDADGFATAFTDLLTSAATDIPVLGTLVGGSVSKALALTSNAALGRELKALEREEDRQKFVDEIAGPISEMIGQAIIQLVKGQHRLSDEQTDALGGLRADLQRFRDELSSSLSPGQARETAATVVETMRVDGDGVGVHVKPGSTHRFEANHVHVTGRGTGFVLD